MTCIRVILVGILALSLLNGGTTRAGTIYDAAADFSPTNNPNGVWSYGWSLSLNSAFNFDAIGPPIAGLDFWQGPFGTNANYGLYPDVLYNGTTSTIYYGTVAVSPGQLGMHPGPQDQFSLIQFTAPTSGTYLLSSSFTGIDFVGPTTTYVYVSLDGSSIFNGAVDGFGAGSGPSFASTLSLAQGDTVDFAVGYGADGNYNYDSTGITATLTLVPEPTSLILLAMGLAGMGVLASNRATQRL